jgi:ribosomal protein L9
MGRSVRAKSPAVTGRASPQKSEVIMGDGPIRFTGEHTVLNHLHADVETEIKVFVNPE